MLDACVAPQVRDELAAAGHEVVWIGDWTEDPGDEAILDTALRESRVLITFGHLCAAALDAYGQQLSKGALLTVEPHRVRLRPGDDDDGGQ